MKHPFQILLSMLLTTSCFTACTNGITTHKDIFQGSFQTDDNKGEFRFWSLVRMHQNGFREVSTTAYYDQLALIILFVSDAAPDEFSLYAVPLSGRGKEIEDKAFSIDRYQLSTEHYLSSEVANLFYADCNGESLGIDGLWISENRNSDTHSGRYQISGILPADQNGNSNDEGLSVSTFIGINAFPITINMKHSADSRMRFLYESAILSHPFISDVIFIDQDAATPSAELFDWSFDKQ